MSKTRKSETTTATPAGKKEKESNLAPIARDILEYGFRALDFNKLENVIRNVANLVFTSIPEDLTETDLSLRLKKVEDIVEISPLEVQGMGEKELKETFVKAQEKALDYVTREIEKHEPHIDKYYSPKVAEIMRSYFIKFKPVLENSLADSKKVLKQTQKA